MINDPYTFNLSVAWLGVLCGLLLGAAIGLFFHQNEWLGGYESWSRRLLRLGHISFIGIAIINFAFVFSIPNLKLDELLWIPSICFAIAEVTMPSACIVAAFWKPGRYLFPLPVISLFIGVIVLLKWGIFT
ncbi:MAG: hypothetical protein QNJ46_03750 [Leptolyngbyaceae cyanobacterium MO_188.B28]|nr:hypothetical protein [Leptolyngbyaceae cyanobacterium MO_188.B28]